ncbi:TatD family hydrolase [Candidatus Fermentibacteria bacterium]|nr:TatD family hydrolase [Candidatus Fermentibacteria bacterium]
MGNDPATPVTSPPNRIVLADAHCHLDQLPDLDAAMAAATDVGVMRMLACSEDEASMRATLHLADRFPETVVPGIGLHPAALVQQSDAAVEAGLAFLCANLHRVAFVGEVGLDYLHAATPAQRQRQHEVLMRQLDVAGRNRLPVCLHSRRAQRETLTIAAQFRKVWGVPALLHWFTHSTKLIGHACAASGIYVSAGPSVLINPSILSVAATVRLDRLLVETDSPVPYGGEPSRPAWIPRIVHALAAVHGMDDEALAVILDENLDRFLFSSKR